MQAAPHSGSAEVLEVLREHVSAADTVDIENEQSLNSFGLDTVEASSSISVAHSASSSMNTQNPNFDNKKKVKAEGLKRQSTPTTRGRPKIKKTLFGGQNEHDYTKFSFDSPNTPMSASKHSTHSAEELADLQPMQLHAGVSAVISGSIFYPFPSTSGQENYE